MKVNTERRDGVLMARVDGRIDAASAADFGAAIDGLIEDGGRALLIDFERLGYINSAGLRVVIMTAKELGRRGMKFALCAMPETVREVFRISGFDTLVAIHPTEAAALAAFDGA